MIDMLEDPRRVPPPFVVGEREMLAAWLDFHRVTLLLKCEGVSDEERMRRPIESSLLSLHGLVRHMVEVELVWFQWRLRGLTHADVRPHYWTGPGSDEDLVPLDEAVWDEDLRTWEAQCEASREAARDLDPDHVVEFEGEDLSLRWIYVHMIEEYARHNGHADLIREVIDGAVGD